jgi:hypothetical protein
MLRVQNSAWWRKARAMNPGKGHSVPAAYNTAMLARGQKEEVETCQVWHISVNARWQQQQLQASNLEAHLIQQTG